MNRKILKYIFLITIVAFICTLSLGCSQLSKESCKDEYLSYALKNAEEVTFSLDPDLKTAVEDSRDAAVLNIIRECKMVNRKPKEDESIPIVVRCEAAHKNIGCASEIEIGGRYQARYYQNQNIIDLYGRYFEVSPRLLSALRAVKPTPSPAPTPTPAPTGSQPQQQYLPNGAPVPMMGSMTPSPSPKRRL